MTSEWEGFSRGSEDRRIGRMRCGFLHSPCKLAPVADDGGLLRTGRDGVSLLFSDADWDSGMGLYSCPALEFVPSEAFAIDGALQSLYQHHGEELAIGEALEPDVA